MKTVHEFITVLLKKEHTISTYISMLKSCFIEDKFEVQVILDQLAQLKISLHDLRIARMKEEYHVCWRTYPLFIYSIEKRQWMGGKRLSLESIVHSLRNEESELNRSLKLSKDTLESHGIIYHMSSTDRQRHKDASMMISALSFIEKDGTYPAYLSKALYKSDDFIIFEHLMDLYEKKVTYQRASAVLREIEPYASGEIHTAYFMRLPHLRRHPLQLHINNKEVLRVYCTLLT